ncbi:hypothetical protein HYO65_gp215 [Tenacibaculum phage PTm1]|uniref:Uncharacterized protein n=2 Tax=Shirahamavirus PTm1 TaxID=2846435 RepID=A0A5S9HXV9_9CAUD|nr:hypothetical protein HYO65_gp215 [Tenacibaculum phage PTm1]BBI90607.1 hypothetical protein [Tenacibaculum phage PTm1]
MSSTRNESMTWWHNMSLEEQFYKTIKHNSLIAGDNTRHPHTLTSSEIIKIYDAENDTNPS